jgi:hypothetical protein
MHICSHDLNTVDRTYYRGTLATMTTTKETDDATARTVGGTMALVGFGVIVLQNLQGRTFEYLTGVGGQDH